MLFCHLKWTWKKLNVLQIPNLKVGNCKSCTEVKNEIKDAEQGRDVVMSDVFKTLRDPLIEQQKKTDAKQDAVIDQLKANQLALTGGLKDLVESNRDVLTLQQELPFAGIEEPPKEKTFDC